MYEYFNNRLDEKIAAYGESRMVRDVARLRALNQQLYDKCVVQDTASNGNIKLDKDMRPYNGDTVAYSIRYFYIIKQEGNVLQEPAAAMNLMFPLKI